MYCSKRITGIPLPGDSRQSHCSYFWPPSRQLTERVDAKSVQSAIAPWGNDPNLQGEAGGVVQQRVTGHRTQEMTEHTQSRSYQSERKKRQRFPLTWKSQPGPPSLYPPISFGSWDPKARRK